MLGFYVIVFSQQANKNYSHKFYTKMLSHITAHGKNRIHD